MKRPGLESLALAIGVVGVVAALLFAPPSGSLPVATYVLATAALAALAAVGETLRARRVQGDPTGLALLAGTCVTLLLLTAAGGRVLEWRFPLPGVGLVLAPMLLSALAGLLLLTADRWTEGASRRAPVVGRRALMLAAGLGAIATVLLVMRGAFASRELALVTAAVFTGTVLLAAGTIPLLEARRSEDAAPIDGSAAQATWAAAGLAALALLAAGAEAWVQDGTYWAGVTRPALLALFFAVAAVQTTALAFWRRLAFAAALVAALVR